MKYCQALFSVLEQKMSEMGRKFKKNQKVVSIRKKITHHILSICEYMCVPGIHTQSRLHTDEKVDMRRQYSFILPAERQHSQMPVETNLYLKPTPCLSVTSLQLTLVNSLQLSLSQSLDM